MNTLEDILNSVVDVGDIDLGSLRDIWNRRQMSTEDDQYYTGQKMGFTYAQKYGLYWEVKHFENFVNIIGKDDPCLVGLAITHCRHSIWKWLTDNEINEKEMEMVRRTLRPEDDMIMISEDFDTGFLVGILLYIEAKQKETLKDKELYSKIKESVGDIYKKIENKINKDRISKFRLIKGGKQG